MNPFWSQIARELSPYVPGEQPRLTDLVKLNTNESPFGPSPLALDAMRAADAAYLGGGSAIEKRSRSPRSAFLRRSSS